MNLLGTLRVLDRFIGISPSTGIGSYYTLPSTPLGGGAVGLAPFHLYETDCSPPHNSSLRGEGPAFILESDFNDNANPETILGTFYGPVQKKNTTPWSSHIKILARPQIPPGIETTPDFDFCLWTDVSQLFDVFGPGQAGPGGTTWTRPRSFGLRVKGNKYVGAGVYMAYPVQGDSVKCADVSGNPAAVWPPICDTEFEGVRPGYVFVISPDCDDDGVVDFEDTNISTCDANCPVADWNNSGSVSVQDIFDFLSHYFIPCTGNGAPDSRCWRTADVNGVSGISVQDIFDFLLAYFSVQSGGNCS